jgi:hypothetical protein
MSDITQDNNNQSTPNGLSIHTETIAKGAIRVKTKLWVDHTDLDLAAKQAVELYIKTLEEYRAKGLKIDGDQ